MENYLELKVPIRRNTKWYKALKCVLRNMIKPDDDWQNGHFHITVAYMYNDDHVSELRKAFDKILKASKPISITLDKLDVFETKHKNFVVYIGPSQPSAELLALINDLRSAAKRIGAKIEDFRLHITLGKIKKATMPIEDVQRALASIVHKPSFTVPVTKVEYRYYKPRRHAIGKWSLN